MSKYKANRGLRYPTLLVCHTHTHKHSLKHTHPQKYLGIKTKATTVV